MNKLVISAAVAGTMLAAAPAQASTTGWEPTTGTTTVAAVNPCTGADTTLTVSWVEARTTTTRSGALRLTVDGTYTGADGSSGTVRITSGTATTRDGYTDTYRQQAVGEYEGRAQRLTFIFRVTVGTEVDVKVQRHGGTCAPA